MPVELTEKQAFLALNALPGIGPIGLNRLLEAFDGDPRAVLSGERRRLEAVIGGRPGAVSAIRDWRAHFDPAKEEARMEKSAVAFLGAGEPGFPPLLSEIGDPPVGLYRKGEYLFDNPCVAIVGSRRATTYGQSVAGKLGAELAERGFCVVSGLARGIDTSAHEGALSVGGRTAAVLGTGIDIIYPPENLDLYRRIAKAGAVLSEFPFGRAADKDSFAMRSRVISGICEAVIVVESDRWGGSHDDRQVRRGAGPPPFCRSRQDRPVRQCRPKPADPRRRDPPDEGRGCPRGDPIPGGAQARPDRRPWTRARRSLATLGSDEARILYHLRGGGSHALSVLAAQSGITAEGTAAALALLESKGLVSRGGDGSFGIAGKPGGGDPRG
jgi:DNA processing protein